VTVLVVAHPANPRLEEDPVQPKTPVIVAGKTLNHTESLVTPVTVAGTQLNHAESLVTPVIVAGLQLNHTESLVG
jgi:hypothetical protein